MSWGVARFALVVTVEGLAHDGEEQRAGGNAAAVGGDGGNLRRAALQQLAMYGVYQVC